MARNVLAFPFAPYAGQFSSRPFKSRGRTGLAVAADILWSAYLANGSPLGTAHPNYTVAVNLNAAGPNSVSQSWNIQSVYVDNLAVNFPVDLYFTDTQFALAVPANSCGWYQVFTQARHVLITALGMSDFTVISARTKVFFTDVEMTPYNDEELPTVLALGISSPSVQLGAPTGTRLGINAAALGDQFQQVLQPLTAGSPAQAMPRMGPFPGQIIYITQVQITVFEFSPSGDTEVTLQSSIVTGPAFIFKIAAVATQAAPQLIYDMRGNFPFDAGGFWASSLSLGGTYPASGRCQINVSFTIAPPR